MDIKFWAYVVIFFALIGFIKWAHYTVDIGGYNRHKAESLTAVNNAVAADRLVEKQKQDKADAEAKKQLDALNSVNKQLTIDIGKLRERPNRKQQPAGTKSSCTGATGAELSGPDAEFLTRFAARAEKTQIGLIACYQHIDDVIQP